MILRGSDREVQLKLAEDSDWKCSGVAKSKAFKAAEEPLEDMINQLDSSFCSNNFKINV